MLRRVFEMNSDGFDRNKVRRALNELVRLSISAGVSDSAAGVLGKMTAQQGKYKQRVIHTMPR
jgi:hypothetical protein